MLKITAEVLRGWDACPEGYKRFNQLFPDGADLKTAADALHDDGHTDWSIWLFDHCRKDERFRDQSVDGFHNTGHHNTGHQNTGNWNTGHHNTGHQNTGNWNTGNWNTGDWNTGNWNTGHQNTGHQNTGDWNTGDKNTGHQNTGDQNTGHQNTGDWNTGHWNTGDWNTGDKNTGHWNTGHQNTGHHNTGDWNTGDKNTGHWNTGDWNTGDKNTGHWNTGDWNTGDFNTITPVDILVFNRPISRQTWDQAAKPSFIFNLVTTWWVDESEMTDEEKAADPESVNRGVQLRIRTYKDAWRKAWNETTDADRRLVLSLPNFDPDVFLAISGIDVRTEL